MKENCLIENNWSQDFKNVKSKAENTLQMIVKLVQLPFSIKGNEGK